MSGPRVSRRGRARLRFDCPWTGHAPDPRIVIRNAAAPTLVGLRCLKCGCLVYEVVDVSPVVGADGAPLPSQKL